jgi:hypothetical protein
MNNRFPIALLLTLFCSLNANATDVDDRITAGVQLIKLGCGTGVESSKVVVSGSVAGSLTLKKVPGVEVGGDISYTKQEAQGLIAALTKTVNADSVDLSKKQMDCMKPYIDRIFDILFPKPSATPPLYDVIVRSDSEFIEHSQFGRIKEFGSVVVIKIDGKEFFTWALEEPFGSHSVRLRAGVHTFEYSTDIDNDEFHDITMQVNCDGTFNVDRSRVYAPHMSIVRKSDGVSTIRSCSLTAS